MISGEIRFSYVGPHGRHTTVYVDNQIVEGVYFTVSCIPLLIWCHCDKARLDIQEVISRGERQRSDFADGILASFKDRALGSKYDILYDRDAIVNAYIFIEAHGGADPVPGLLFSLDAYIADVKERFLIDKLEVIYELNENEIYDGCRV